MKSTLVILLLGGLVAAGCADKLPIDPTGEPSTPTSGERLLVSYAVDQGSSSSFRVASAAAGASVFTKVLDGIVVSQPYGGRMVFLGPGFSSVGGVIVADIDGKNQASVGASPAGASLSWFSPVLSPSATKVSYVVGFPSQTSGQDTGKIYVADVTGLNRVLIDVNVAHETPAVFSPDGKYIAYFTGDYAGAKDGRLVIRDVAASSPPDTLLENLDLVGDGYTGIAWSPDGTKIVFNSNAPTGEPQLIELTVAGKSAQVLALGALGTYSRDGSRIAFVGGGVADIAIINSGGGAITNLTNTTTELEMFPSWSSNGKEIVCTVFGGEPDEVPGRLRIVNVDTKSFVDRAVVDPEGPVSIYRAYFVK